MDSSCLASGRGRKKTTNIHAWIYSTNVLSLWWIVMTTSAIDFTWWKCLRIFKFDMLLFIEAYKINMFHNNTKRFMLKSSVIQTHLTWPTLRNGKFKRTDKWNFSMKLKGTRVFPKLLSSKGKNRGKKKKSRGCNRRTNKLKTPSNLHSIFLL